MRVKLEDVCERGSSNLKQSDVTEMTGDYPIYGASGYIGNVDFYHQENSYVAVVKDGAGIGRTTLHPAKSSVIGTMQYLLPKDNVLPEYLYYVVSYMHLEKYFTGATIPHIYFKDYKNEEFNLDSLEKQKEIVDALGKCEAVIVSRKQELQLLDNLIKARFVELFGDPKTNSKRLKLVSPEDVCELISAGGDKPDEVSEVKTDEFCYPIFSNGEKDNGLYGWSKVYRVEKPSLTVSGRGTIGFTAYRHKGKFTPIVRLIVMTPNEKVNPLYLLQYMNMERETGSGSGVQQLTVPMIKAKKIMLPSIELQNQFADFVKQVDKSKVAVQKSLDEAQLLFDSLMQQYFG